MLERLHYAMVGSGAVNEFQNLRKIFFIHSWNRVEKRTTTKQQNHKHLRTCILYLFCKYDKDKFSINQNREACYRTEILQYVSILFLGYRQGVIRDQIKGIKDNSILDFLFLELRPTSLLCIQFFKDLFQYRTDMSHEMVAYSDTFSVDTKVAYYLEAKSISFLLPYKMICKNER